MSIACPEITPERCLNANASVVPEAACTLCRDICPADAIALDAKNMPRLDTGSCTACTACVHSCPSDAVGHAAVIPEEILQQAIRLSPVGLGEISAACQAVERNDPNSLSVPCHGVWDPLLLASLAAEGVHTLHLDGISQCENCPVKHGAARMQQCETEYDALSKGLGVRLNIARTIKAKASAPASPAGETEPSRRAFFRSLIPSLAQGAAVASAHLSQAAGQAVRSEAQNTQASNPLLPVRLRLFLRALPRLKPTFTPVPAMPGLPLGAIQADESCTACGKCVEICPTKALSQRNFGTKVVLEFRSDACIGCQQCVVSCPEGALEPLPGISLPSLLAQRNRPLVMVTASKTNNT